MKLKNASSVILLVVCLSGAGYFYLYGHPRYSFYLVGKAIKDHDVELFNKYVDVDSVVEEWVNWSSEAARQELKEATRAENNPIGEGFVELMLPSMKIKLREEFKAMIIKGIEQPKKEAALSGLPIINIALLPIHKIQIQNRLAAVEIIHPTSEEKIIFKMRRTPQRYWRIISIQIPSLMQRKLRVKKEAISKQPQVQAVTPQLTEPILQPQAPPQPKPAIEIPNPQEITEKRIAIQESMIAQIERENILMKSLVNTEYYQRVKERINNCIPSGLKKLKSGKVNLRLVMLPSGEIKELNIISEKTTASANIQKTLLKAIKRASPFPVFPKESHYANLELNFLISLE